MNQAYTLFSSFPVQQGQEYRISSPPISQEAFFPEGARLHFSSWLQFLIAETKAHATVVKKWGSLFVPGPHL